MKQITTRGLMATTRAFVATTTILASAVVAWPTPASGAMVRDGQWYLEQLQVEAAHRIATGAGVRVGIIDSGVDATHPDLVGAVVDGREFNTSTDYRQDPDGHGTEVASVLAGRGGGAGVLGIAPDAELVVAATGDNFETGSGDARAIVVDAINYLVDADVDVISISLGVDAAEGGEEAVQRAVEAGIPVVASAGNSVREGSITPDQNVPVEHPAAYPDALAVTGSNQAGEFSQWSVHGKDGLRYPDDLTVAAPADDIPVAVPGGGYEVRDGTSLAAPIVAGTIALIRQHWPDLGPGDWSDLVNQVLLNGTTDVDNEEGFNRDLGYGIVQPLQALQTPLGGHAPSAPDTTVTTVVRRDDPSTREAADEAASDQPDEEAADQAGADAADAPDEQAAPEPRNSGNNLPLAVGMVLVGLVVVVCLVARARRAQARAPGAPAPPAPGPPRSG